MTIQVKSSAESCARSGLRQIDTDSFRTAPEPRDVVVVSIAVLTHFAGTRSAFWPQDIVNEKSRKEGEQPK